MSAALASVMLVSAAPFVSAATLSFTDTTDHWAWKNGQIPYLVEKEVLNGYKQSDGTYIFKPNGEVKRSEFIKMLDETFGLTAKATINYSDVEEGDWFYEYYQKAAAQGYILNYGSSGYPNGYITREEATALLVRYLGLPAGDAAPASTFKDADSISGNFKNYVLVAVKAGIINGYEESTGTYFKPQKTLTRAEALTILYKAAGCIYDKTVSSRESGAHSTNNTITDAGITISNVKFTGRNIITEGAENGAITFSNCTFTDDLYIRGSADVTFTNCELGKVYAYNGGDISTAGDTEIDYLYVEKTSELNIFSGTKVHELDIALHAENVKATGNGALGKVYILADGFASSMMPEQYEIGNNLSAAFAGNSYYGRSDEQNSFSLEPFASVMNDEYYINTVMEAGGRLYYYYTDLATVPTTDSYNSYYERSSNASYIDVSAGDVISHRTFTKSQVGDSRYVVLQLKDGSRRYAPVLVSNSVKTVTGFSTEPYLADAKTIKFKSQYSGTVYWFYTDDANRLTELQFLTQFEEKESALKGEISVNSIKTFACELKSAYLENYSHVAFMLIGSDGSYYNTVIVSAGDSGFSEVPAVTSPGTVKFKTNVSGKLYWYLSDEDYIPAADKFNSNYKAANSSRKGNMNVTKNNLATFTYDPEDTNDYPYMVIAIKTENGDWLQPIVIGVNYSTGFRNAPEIKNEHQISYRAKDAGSIKWYYTADDKAPTSAEFNERYSAAKSKYKGSDSSISATYEYIEYNASYTAQYPYMAIMLTGRNGNDYCPVVISIDVSEQTGFITNPYVQDGKICFKTSSDGEVWYYYSKSSSSVSPDEFYSKYSDAYSSRRDVYNADAGVLESFEIDLGHYENGYDNIVLAFCTDESENEFAFPYVVNIEESELQTSGTGIEVHAWSTMVEAKALADGTIFWYTTNNESDLTYTYNEFLTEYQDKNSAYKGSENVDKNEEFRLYYEDLRDYVVLCFYANGEYFRPVVVNVSDRTVTEDNGESGEFDDGSTKSGTGFSHTSYSTSEREVYVMPNHSGTVTVFTVSVLGKAVLATAEVTADDMASISVPALGNINSDILTQLGGVKIYVQLTTASGTYEAYQLY